jgi:hypothetical protein
MNIDTEHKLNLELTDLIGQRIGLLGVSGSGKSNTLKVLVEEVASADQRVPMTIVDPEGEYWPLKQVGDFIVVGQEGQADVDCDVAQAASLARFSVEQGVSVILSLVHLRREDMVQFVELYLTALWEAQLKKKRPYLLIVEEAHEFAPQSRPSPVKDLLIQVAKRGRKHGLGLMVATQRASAIDKDVLTQTTMLVLHQVTYPADLSVYQSIVPLKNADVDAMNQGLGVGQAMIVRGKRDVDVVQMRRAQTFDAGATPGLDAEDLPPLRPVDSAMLKELKALFEKTVAPVVDHEKDELRKRLAEVEQINDELSAANTAHLATIERLKTQVETLGAIRITVNQPSNGMLITEPAAPSVSIAPSQPVPAPPVPTNHVEAAITSAAMQREQRSFNALLRDIESGITPPWKAAYSYLLSREGERFSHEQLIRRLGYSSVNSLKSYPPKILLEEGMLDRTRSGNKLVYWATTRQALQKRFPNLDADSLYHRILEVVSAKIK